VSELTSTFFGGVLGWANMTPGARAVAGTSPGPDCVITLGPPGIDPPSMEIGNSVLTMPGCEVSVGGDLETTNPNADINADGTGTTGNCIGDGCDNISGLAEELPPPTDPFAGMTEPPNPGNCISVTNPTTPLAPGCYSGISASNMTLTLTGGGIYYITGPILIGNNVTVIGNAGLMFFFAGTAPVGDCTAGAPAGCIKVRNSAEFHISAMTSGDYTGILMFQAPDNHLKASFDGNNPIYDLSGAMYFPGAAVSFRNGLNASNDCMIFVSYSLNIDNGNGSFDNTCSAYGGSPIESISVAE
jgi:hypothetical protein